MHRTPDNIYIYARKRFFNPFQPTTLISPCVRSKFLASRNQVGSVFRPKGKLGWRSTCCSCSLNLLREDDKGTFFDHQSSDHPHP